MKKWLKPEIILLLSSVLLSLAVSFVLFATPFISLRGPLTVSEAEAISWLEASLFKTEIFVPAGLSILAALTVIYCTSLLRSINGAFRFEMFKSVRGALIWLLAICAVIVSIGSTVAPLTRILAFYSLMFYFLTFINALDFIFDLLKILKYSVPILGFALVWLLAGSGQSSKGNKTRLLDALRGAGVGLAVVLFIFMADTARNIIEGWGYLLYHGQPREFNPYMQRIYTISSFLESWLLTGGIAGVAIAASLQEFSRKTRIKWAGLPIALCAGLFLFSGLFYFDNRHELIELQKPLSVSAGISTEAQPPRKMVVLLKDEGGEVVQWPAEFRFKRPRYAEETYPATQDNLEKLSEYAEKSQAGMLLTDYVDALIDGYLSIWNERKARETVVNYADDFLLYRMFAPPMFAFAPATQENKALLRKMVERTEWQEKGTWAISGAMDFCRMHMKMDMEDEGEKWCSIVRADYDRGWGPTVDIIPVNGIVRGTMNIDSQPMREGRIALLRANRDLKNDMDEGRMLITLIATTEPGTDGRFEFTGLKQIPYELAVIFEEPPQSEITGIQNPPGIINATGESNFFDLGVVNIRTD